MDWRIVAVESVIIAALGVGFALALLLRALKRSRPELLVGKPIAVGYSLRLLVIAGISVTGIGATIRGGDEFAFMHQARALAPLSWASPQWLPTNHQSFLHVILFAAQIKVLSSPEGALRVDPGRDRAGCLDRCLRIGLGEAA